jgi:hypothetical protein
MVKDLIPIKNEFEEVINLINPEELKRAIRKERKKRMLNRKRNHAKGKRRM